MNPRTDDRSEREKHLEELYQAMKAHCQDLEEKIKILEKKIEILIYQGLSQNEGEENGDISPGRAPGV